MTAPAEAPRSTTPDTARQLLAPALHAWAQDLGSAATQALLYGSPRLAMYYTRAARWASELATDLTDKPWQSDWYVRAAVLTLDDAWVTARYTLDLVAAPGQPIAPALLSEAETLRRGWVRVWNAAEGLR